MLKTKTAFKTALDNIEHILQIEKPPINFTLLCNILIENDYTNEAIKYFPQAISNSNKAAELFVKFIKLTQSYELKQKAVALFKSCIKKEKDFMKLLNYGQELQKEEQTQYAMNCFCYAIKISTNTVETYIKISMHLVKDLGQKKALESLKAAQKLKSNNIQDYIKLENALF